MGDSHEVLPDPFFDEWWDDGWRIQVTPVVGVVELKIAEGEVNVVRDDRRSNPEFKRGDRVLWWKHDEDRNELGVRIPQEHGQDPDQGLWLEKRYHLTDDGRLASTGHIELREFSRSDPLTSELQSALGLRGINQQVERHLRVVARLLELGEEWERATVDVRRPGRKGMSDLELVQWAQRYVEALEEESRRPYAVLMERYPGWSDSGLKSIVRRSRKAGFLTEVGRGKTGGELTDNARRLLAGQAWAGTEDEDTNTETEEGRN